MTAASTKPPAVWVDCPGVVAEGKYRHSLRDGCWNCAPFWERYPTCPTHAGKLPASGWCRACHRYYRVSRRKRAA